MREDRNVVITTNDMNAMILDQIREELPEQVVNIGIAEQNLMSVSGGLAQCGKSVFAFGISAHVISRGWEQIKLDICAMNLPVTILGVGPGLSYGNDGPTHHGTEDLALTRALPNMTILNPSDGIAMENAVKYAYAGRGPTYIRVDREQIEPRFEPTDDLSAGLKVWRDGGPIVLVATGVMVHRAQQAADILAQQGIECRVVEVYRLKPVEPEALVAALGDCDTVVAIDEHSAVGGLGSLLAECLVACRRQAALHNFCLPAEFLLGSASRAWAHQEFNLAADRIAAQVAGLTE